MESLVIAAKDALVKVSLELIDKDKPTVTMDPLDQAALDGNVDILKKLYEENIKDTSSYFLGRKEFYNGNFIHRAVRKNHYPFLSEALKLLPPDVVLGLLCQIDKVEGSNPLHYAAMEGNIFTVKLLVHAYVTAATTLGKQGPPPWLTKNNNGNTPLRSCFIKKIKKVSRRRSKLLSFKRSPFAKDFRQAKMPAFTGSKHNNGDRQDGCKHIVLRNARRIFTIG